MDPIEVYIEFSSEFVYKVDGGGGGIYSSSISTILSFCSIISLFRFMKAAVFSSNWFISIFDNGLSEKFCSNS